MTNSDKKSIVDRVNWIHKNRETYKKHNLEINKIKSDMSTLSEETLNVIE